MEQLQLAADDARIELQRFRSRRGLRSKQQLIYIAAVEKRLYDAETAIQTVENQTIHQQNQNNDSLSNLFPTIQRNLDLLNQQYFIEDQFSNIFNSSYEENAEFVHIFETNQKSFVLDHCTICNKISSKTSNNIWESCRKFPHPNEVGIASPIADVNPFSVLNNMDPGIVPDELLGLTFIEQILISRVKVCMTVFRLQGGQYGYNGRVINFNQDVCEMANSLPHSLDSLSNVLVIRRDSEDVSSFSEFRVRKRVVWNALNFLIRSHSGYRNIVSINQNNLDQLNEDESVLGSLTQIPFNNHDNEISNETLQETLHLNESIDLMEHTAATSIHIPNIRENVDSVLNVGCFNEDIQQNVEEDEGLTILPFPSISPEPINEFTTPGYIACAFPCLFPTGNYCFLKHLFLLKNIINIFFASNFCRCC